MRVSDWLFPAFVGACTPSKPGLEPAEAAALAPENAAASRSTSTAPPIPADETWAGAYVSQVGSIYVVDGGEWAAVKWRGDDASTGLGEGALALTIHGAARRLTGTGSGALGDLVWVGALDGDTLTASVQRRDPLDRGFTGTAVGKVSGDEIVGTMRLSLADARIIRGARFTLTRGKP